MVARFVLHGLGARTSVLAEAASTRDVIFLRAPSVMSCKSGPLRKLWLWLECALSAWPHATMVGKADDDAWLRLPGVALHASRAIAVAAAHTAAAAQATRPAAAHDEPPLLAVWASIASFHWHEGMHRPVGYTGQRWAHRMLPGEGFLQRCRSRQAPAKLLQQRTVPKEWLHTAGGDAGPNVTGGAPPTRNAAATAPSTASSTRGATSRTRSRRSAWRRSTRTPRTSPTASSASSSAR